MHVISKISLFYSLQFTKTIAISIFLLKSLERNPGSPFKFENNMVQCKYDNCKFGVSVNCFFLRKLKDKLT